MNKKIEQMIKQEIERQFKDLLLPPSHLFKATLKDVVRREVRIGLTDSGSKSINEMIDKRYYYRWHINTIVPLKEDIEAIKRRLKAYFNCPFCGFDQDKPDPFYGTSISREIRRNLGLTGTAGECEVPCDVCGVLFKPTNSNKYACDSCCPPLPESTKREKMRMSDFIKGQPGAAKTATETAMEQHQEHYDLYRWLNGKTDKKPPLADKVLEKLLSSTKVADSERESLKYMREVFKAHPDMFQWVKPEDMPKGFAESPTVPGTIEEATLAAGEAKKLKCLCKTEPFCPLHTIMWRGTPDLPLHARVAKALGNKPSKIGDNWYVVIPESDLEDYYAGAGSWRIPDYPNDLVAAMGALEEYCRNYKPKKYGAITYAGVNFHPDKKMNAESFHAMINHVVYNYGIGESATTAAKAICKVIIRHDNEQI